VALPHSLPLFTAIRKALWQEPESRNKQENHAVATPLIPQNPECSASNRIPEITNPTPPSTPPNLPLRPAPAYIGPTQEEDQPQHRPDQHFCISITLHHSPKSLCHRQGLAIRTRNLHASVAPRRSPLCRHWRLCSGEEGSTSASPSIRAYPISQFPEITASARADLTFPDLGIQEPQICIQ